MLRGAACENLVLLLELLILLSGVQQRLRCSAEPPARIAGLLLDLLISLLELLSAVFNCVVPVLRPARTPHSTARITH